MYACISAIYAETCTDFVILFVINKRFETNYVLKRVSPYCMRAHYDVRFNAYIQTWQ